MATPAEGADYDEGDGQEDTATMLVTMDEMAKSTLRRVSTTSIIGRDRKASVASSSGRESTSLEGIRRTSIRRISTALSMSEAEIAQATSPTKINKSIQRKISLHQEQGVKLRDLVLLPTISTESVVDTLQQRYAEDLIYVRTGIGIWVQLHHDCASTCSLGLNVRQVIRAGDVLININFRIRL